MEVLVMEGVTYSYALRGASGAERVKAGMGLTQAATDPGVFDVNLTLSPGEMVAVVGPNGSGKSTLARLAAGLLVPQKGRVQVDELDTKNPCHRLLLRQRVGILFSYPPSQIVGCTVEEDVAFGPENLGLAPEIIAERIDWALEAVGLSRERFLDPRRLSGGQQVKVALAGILALGPSYIILDEPTAMLDPGERTKIWELVRGFCQSPAQSQGQGRSGAGVLWITHREEEARNCDRALVMSCGRLTGTRATSR
ncbi:MAG: ATP-binding cassette domain-containing protein [Clostridia bacterium]|nr:ATP-binding cassette domain-containing protein [Clostridia bacterium]